MNRQPYQIRVEMGKNTSNHWPALIDELIQARLVGHERTHHAEKARMAVGPDAQPTEPATAARSPNGFTVIYDPASIGAQAPSVQPIAVEAAQADERQKLEAVTAERDAVKVSVIRACAAVCTHLFRTWNEHESTRPMANAVHIAREKMLAFIDAPAIGPSAEPPAEGKAEGSGSACVACGHWESSHNRKDGGCWWPGGHCSCKAFAPPPPAVQAEPQSLGERVQEWCDYNKGKDIATDVRLVLSQLADANARVARLEAITRIASLPPDEDGDCLHCHGTMVMPDAECEPTALCHACAQAVLADVCAALEVKP